MVKQYLTRPVAVIMITIGLCLFGVISLARLPQNLLPSLGQPVLTIETTLANSSPTEVERIVTESIEDSLGTLNGLSHLESLSLPSKSIVKLKFVRDHSIEKAMSEVRESLDRMRLPDEAEEPRIIRYDPNLEPIMRLSFLAKSMTSVRLRDLVEENIAPILQSLPGVATTLLRGGQKEEVIVGFEKDTLELFGLGPADIVSALEQYNQSAPVGSLRVGEQEAYIKLTTRIDSVAAMQDLQLVTKSGGKIRLGEVATVKRQFIFPETITRRNGQDAVFVDIYKEADANIVQVVDRMNATIGNRLTKLSWMNGVEVEVIRDESIYIRKSLENVTHAGLAGAFLAMIVLFVFLGSPLPALLISLTIPISVAVTFFFMDRQGISLNIMSLGGLALGIGMLVDNAIVVLENIDKKKLAGMHIMEAAEKGTKEILSPVVASTLTSIAVFAPLAFVEGVAGKLFSDLAWTIIYSLSVSLLVATILLPTLYVLFARFRQKEFVKNLEPKHVFRRSKNLSHLTLTQKYLQACRKAWLFDFTTLAKSLRSLFVVFKLPFVCIKGLFFVLLDSLTFVLILIFSLLSVSVWLLFWPLRIILKPVFSIGSWVRRGVSVAENKVYPNALKATLSKSYLCLGLVIASAMGAYYAAIQMGGELLPSMSEDRLTLRGEVDVGSSLRKTSSTSFAFEEVIRNYDGVKAITSIIGWDDAESLQGKAGLHRFRIDFEVDSEFFKLENLRKELGKTEGVNWEMTRPSLAQSDSPIDILILDNDMNRLISVTKSLSEKLAAQDYLYPLGDTMSKPVKEYEIRLNDTRLTTLGLKPANVEQAVSFYLTGEYATSVDLNDKTLSVNVKAEKSQMKTIQDLLSLLIPTQDGELVSLASLANLTEVAGPAYVFRHSGTRAMRLSYGANQVDLKAAILRLKAILPDNTLHTEFRILGQSEEYESSMNSLIFAVGLAIFMVYLVMASQFESFRLPLFIMVSIPLAFIGVVGLLYPTGTTINIMVMVGAIVLIGIIVNNAIIFVDLAQKLRNQGMNASDALIKSGSLRLRPILMTTLTTVFGLIPLAFSEGEGAQLSTTIGLTVIGGLGFGTLLTLVIIPVLLYILKSYWGKKAVNL